MRWLIGDIFRNLREADLELGIKFENINTLYLKDNFLFIHFFKKLFLKNEEKNLKKILIGNLAIKDILLIQEEEKLPYPFPVLNSKFNNFVTNVTIVSADKWILEFYQKDNKKYYEKIDIFNENIESFLKSLELFTLKKITLLKELYRYNQIILPFKHFKDKLLFLNNRWNKFLKEKKLDRFVDRIYFYM